MTVVVGFPTNLVAVLEAQAEVDFFGSLLGMIIIAGLIFLAVWWYIVYPLWITLKWYLYGRDQKSNVGLVTVSF